MHSTQTTYLPTIHSDLLMIIPYLTDCLPVYLTRLLINPYNWPRRKRLKS